jgi:hypothetical protein
MLVVVTLVLAGCGSSDETNSAVTSTTTTMAITTAPAPSTATSLVDAEAPAVTVVFDGETCAYRGPAQTSSTEILGVELQNTSGTTILLMVVEFSDEDQAAMAAAIGENFTEDTNELFSAPPVSVALALRTEPGATTAGATLLLPATYTVMCESFQPTRVWPAGIIEST